MSSVYHDVEFVCTDGIWRASLWPRFLVTNMYLLGGEIAHHTELDVLRSYLIDHRTCAAHVKH